MISFGIPIFRETVSPNRELSGLRISQIHKSDVFFFGKEWQNCVGEVQQTAVMPIKGFKKELKITLEVPKLFVCLTRPKKN